MARQGIYEDKANVHWRMYACCEKNNRLLYENTNHKIIYTHEEPE